MHTIKLIQHSRKLRALIQNAHHMIDSSKSSESDIASLPDAPPIPEFEGRPLKHTLGTPVPFLPKSTESNFVRGFGEPPPVIDRTGCQQLLRRSIMAICAHAGFESCPDTVLDILTDICHEYFLRMTQQLRQAVDNEARSGSTGFQDVIEQVFHEMGMAGTSSLHNFYQTRVLTYHDTMQRTCEQLMAEYERLLNPDLPPSDDKASVKVKDELMSDIQFPNADEAEEILDPDQLLQLGEGLGLEINMVQESSNNMTEDESGGGSKTEPPERATSTDSFDGDESHQSGTELPSTPRFGSDAGDSLKDPGSVPSSDIMSPPSARTNKTKRKKKK